MLFDPLGGMEIMGAMVIRGGTDIRGGTGILPVTIQPVPTKPEEALLNNEMILRVLWNGYLARF
ncbi:MULTISPECIES: hypothetical protein [unclassified Moorena]|uniref:Uncharacterized protein n=2 Tax=Moorena TaxID=1155738 RepID=F4Y1U8_9CYAN|nr:MULTISPECIES: hypothetical protein [unclassified Moorena]EGJ29240.1 hypothetical protein LYNGBM3L_64800 [Moorena producens 3L]NEP53664.1 hypothetical protein [Moorena sp. SIO3C2]NEP36195.1 hypothetical protein [Moorena sp. SIO3B2]NEP67430.1 hypothetical protein [Moorena sp. SIO3A5]OLT64477.1 hypothetical protein BI334_05055 [Moorena producens 3L]